MLFSVTPVKDYFPITIDHGCVDGTKSDAFDEGLLMNPALRSLDGSYTWKRTLDFFSLLMAIFVYICITLEINSFHDLTEWTISSARKKLRHQLPCSQRSCSAGWRWRRPQWWNRSTKGWVRSAQILPNYSSKSPYVSFLCEKRNPS